MGCEAPDDRSAIHAAVWEALLDCGLPVVLTSHVRLDGDGLGSTLAMRHGLAQLGADARVVLQPPLPGLFDFLPGMDLIGTDATGLPAEYNLAVIDCGNMDRVGEIGAELAGARRVVSIDHHDSHSGFGHVNYVDAAASSCGEMIYGLLLDRGVRIDRPIAECLYTAILTDTGQFSHGDTTPEALEVCAECLRKGARPDELVRRIYHSPSPAQVRLQQMALGTLKFHDGGRVATMAVTEDMLRATGLGPIDTEGFAEMAIRIEGVEAAALLKEMPGYGYIKVSMRSRDAVDVCAAARVFGGGGHVHAAGCEIPEDLDTVRRKVAEQLALHLPEAARG
jgi:phosphoesterase RecJ-like protein